MKPSRTARSKSKSKRPTSSARSAKSTASGVQIPSSPLHPRPFPFHDESVVDRVSPARNVESDLGVWHQINKQFLSQPDQVLFDGIAIARKSGTSQRPRDSIRVRAGSLTGDPRDATARHRSNSCFQNIRTLWKQQAICSYDCQFEVPGLDKPRSAANCLAFPGYASPAHTQYIWIQLSRQTLSLV